MDPIINKIRTSLIQSSEEKFKLSQATFFKEPILIYGVRSAKVKQIAHLNFQFIKKFDKYSNLDLCTELWQSGYLEEGIIASSWSYQRRFDFVETDFDRFEYWVDHYINNWATCDTFCTHTLGNFIEQYPVIIPRLQKWTVSANRWLRRGVAVSFILPARLGHFRKEIFEIADSLLLDQDDLVQKGYGWLLKEASKCNPQAVFKFVQKNKKIMPRTSLRYAIEKLPFELRIAAMSKN
jgi:3-methyladenine DNA glycosylase AlkD